MRYVVFDYCKCLVLAVLKVDHFEAFEAGQRFDTKYKYARDDHAHRDDGHQARPLGRLRILEQQPELALEAVCGQYALLLFHETCANLKLVVVKLKFLAFNIK